MLFQVVEEKEQILLLHSLTRLNWLAFRATHDNGFMFACSNGALWHPWAMERDLKRRVNVEPHAVKSLEDVQRCLQLFLGKDVLFDFHEDKMGMRPFSDVPQTVCCLNDFLE